MKVELLTIDDYIDLINARNEFLAKHLGRVVVENWFSLQDAGQHAGIVQTGANADGEHTANLKIAKERLRYAFGGRAKDMTELMGINISGGDRSYADLSELSDFFDASIEDWEDARQFCRSAIESRAGSRRELWREDIKRDYPHLYSQGADLIERSQPMDEWPEEIINTCLEQGGEDRARDIALEYAARRCGANPYDYKLSTLENYYRKQKREKAK